MVAPTWRVHLCLVTWFSVNCHTTLKLNMVPQFLQMSVTSCSPLLSPIPWCTSVIVKNHSSKSWQELNDIKHWKEGTPLTHPRHTRCKLWWKPLFKTLDALASRFMYNHKWHTKVPMFSLFRDWPVSTHLYLFSSLSTLILCTISCSYYRALWASPHTSHALILKKRLVSLIPVYSLGPIILLLPFLSFTDSVSLLKWCTPKSKRENVLPSYLRTVRLFTGITRLQRQTHGFLSSL